MATAWCRNTLRKQEARGGENVGGFLKEAPKPPRTLLEFIFDRTNALRQSHAGSLFQSQCSAARVQPPGTCMTGAIGNTGGKPSPGACFSGSACAACDSVPGYLHGRVCKCRKRFNARGAGGGSPRQNNLRVSPFPAGEGSWGDRGQQRKLTAGAAGDQKGKPPLRAPQRQCQPATPVASPLRVPASQVQPVPQAV